MARDGTMQGQFRRLGKHDRRPVAYTIDGVPATALEGDTVLVAILTARRALCRGRSDGRVRAGFCLMGACQDCWLSLADGTALRACTAQLQPGMAVVTRGGDD